jgi:hypothetical protein
MMLAVDVTVVDSAYWPVTVRLTLYVPITA